MVSQAFCLCAVQKLLWILKKYLVYNLIRLFYNTFTNIVYIVLDLDHEIKLFKLSNDLMESKSFRF